MFTDVIQMDLKYCKWWLHVGSDLFQLSPVLVNTDVTGEQRLMRLCWFVCLARIHGPKMRGAKRPEMICSADEKSCWVGSCMKAKADKDVEKHAYVSAHTDNQVTTTLNILILSIHKCPGE